MSVPFTPRLEDGNIKVKGELVFVANNSVSIRSNPNVAYTGNSNNDNMQMGYIDIDDDPTTFSSSSAELNAPDCSRVIYAGLYWGGIYRDTNRNQPYKSIKFKVPGGSYVDIGPASNPSFEYEQIYDKDGDRNGDGVTDPGVVDVDFLSGVNMTSYLNYANVTQLLTSLPDPNGEYTAANVVASVTNATNVSAGWIMVVIYENPNSTSKYISTFDGYAAIGSTNPSVNFPFSGFRTLPAPQPVNAVIGAGAIDGDRSTGPSMRFRATPSNSWTYLSDALNPTNNVFNSTITKNGVWVDTRNPASRNTLGWDADLIALPNPGNAVLPNNHSSGEILINSTNEGVLLFLTTVSVEIIDPDIIVEKKVENLAGQDITGGGVNLGQSLEYVLRFWNRGNDDATNFEIRDVLPDNVSLENIDLSGAPGTTYTTSGADPRELIFNVPNTLVAKEGSRYEIRIQVKVSDNCQDFVAACSATIHNIAYSTYIGNTSGRTISNDPSVSNVDNCGLITVGATNFLLDDLTNCSFASEVQLCGDNVVITAGSGYDSYTWYRDVNENGQIDALDTLFNDGNPDNDTATIVVQETGYYLVRKESASCGINIESKEVIRFGTTQVNPIITYMNALNGDTNPTNDVQGEIAICPNDGSQLPKLFLCGADDSQTIVLNINDAQGIIWQKLVEGSCGANNEDCANTQASCTWANVGTGNSYTVSEEGQYRLTLNYAGGCNSRFYFNVFQNNLDFTYTKTDIFCSSEGNITVGNIGGAYGFQLVNTVTDAIVVPFSANNGPSFDIATSGIYRVDFTAMDPITGEPIPGSCVFSTPELGVRNEQLEVVLSTTQTTCLVNGSIRIRAQQARPNYYYELYTDNGSGQPGTFIDDEPAQTSNDHTFTNLNVGDYVVVVRTDDGCEAVNPVSITQVPDPVVNAVTTQNIACFDGQVTLTAIGGVPSPEYLFAIWEKDGATSYTTPSDIPITEFQRDTIASGIFRFAPGTQGNYRFIVVDGNNCWSLSNVVTVANNGPLAVAPPTINRPVVCNSSATGEITINATGGISPYSYSINNGTTFQSSPTFFNLAAGNYDIVVRDSSDCEEHISFALVNPDVFTAFAGISSNATCDVNGYSEVRFTNVEGGTEPYQFSFDGGSTYITDNPSDPSVRTHLLPSGSHILVARDALGCQVTIPLVIDIPPPVPVFSEDVAYDCEGNGTATLSANLTLYDYTYTINTSPSRTAINGVFTGIPAGTYLITATYSENDPPSPSVLLHEDFGSGGTVSSPYTLGYVYEDQVGANTQINDYEYSVTNRIVSPHGGWIQPGDHTSNGTDTNGRYLVINVGTPAPGQVIYQKPIRDIVPNQNLRVSFAAFNLLGNGGQLDPDLVVQMRISGTTTVVGEVRTNDIPKNRIWNVFEFNMDPENNTELDFVIISEKIGTNGNDVAIDDIRVEQTPRSCARTQEISVVIEDGYAFSADIISYENISCNGAHDGSITFEVENFDTVAGFEYSVNGGPWVLSTTSPVTTSANLDPGNQSITIRKVDDIGCFLTLDQTLSEPLPLTVSTSIVQDPTCSDPVGTLRATASGGSPTYEYALEDGDGNVLVAFPNPTGADFYSLSTGNYRIVARDINNCTANSSVISIEAPVALTYSVDATACYDGSNNATIQLTASTGNGGYLFQLNGGPWMAPTPVTGNTYTFSGLANGSYDVNVRDAYGCDGGVVTVNIADQILASVAVTHVSSCADGSISINANGGDANLVYAIVPANMVPVEGDFVTTNTFSINNTMALANLAGYDVHVRDHGGVAPFCTYIEEDVIINPAVELEISAVPTDPNCNGGSGSIMVTVQQLGGGSLTAAETAQVGPFSYELWQGGSVILTVGNIASVENTFNNIVAGTYEVRMTDGLGCTLIQNSITLSDPPELTANLETQFAAGLCTPAEGFFFKDYPTTLNGTLQFSYDNGNTWQASDSFVGIGLTSGDEVYPSIRTVDGSGNTLCRTDLPRYTLSYPLDDLDITIDAVVIDCNNLTVTVQGSQGTAPYVYVYSEDPVSFDPNTALWTSPAQGLSDPYVFSGLVPGRTYVFYVQDANGCVRQSTINVNEIPEVELPIDIVSTVRPSCFGENNGEISYAINPDAAHPEMRWEFYQVGNAVPFQTSGGNIPFNNTLNFTDLPQGDYYIQIVQVDEFGIDACIGGSENAQVTEQLDITATASSARDIGCSLPGLIQIANINGGTAPHTFTVTGPLGFTPITDTAQNPIEIPANSPAGDYVVTVTDVYGCASGTSYTVAMALTPNPTIDAIAVENCATPITLSVTASSVVGNLRYAMVATGSPVPSVFLTNNGDFANVVPGTYDLYAMDGNGCSVVQTNFTVHPPLQASAELTKALDCSASPDAQITIEALQGSGMYSYSVTNVTTSVEMVAITPILGNTVVYATPTAGTYEITVYVEATADHEACERTFTVEVPDAIVPIFTATGQDATCNGSQDGRITLLQTDNGISPLTYELLDASLAPVPVGDYTYDVATRTFLGLAVGDYIVRAQGANSCTTDSVIISIGEPDLIVLPSVTVVEFACALGNNGDNASITIDPTLIAGGSGTYVRFEFRDPSNNVVQNGSITSLTITDLSGGNYTVNVYDDAGCMGTLIVPIAPFDILGVPTLVVDDQINCVAGETITITANGSITDSTAPSHHYSFEQIGTANVNTDGVFIGLPVGLHTFRITNTVTGCSTLISHNVAEIARFEIDVENDAPVVCAGEISENHLVLTGYTGAFTWEAFNTNGTLIDTSDDSPAGNGNGIGGISTGPSVSLAKGTYRIVVAQADFPFCTEETMVTIGGADTPLAATITEIGNASCSNDNGSLSVHPTRGIAPYTIAIPALSLVQADVYSYVFPGLSNGSYDVEITDAAGCVQTFIGTIATVLPIIADITPAIQILDCIGDADGSISAIITSGGIGDVFYSLNTIVNGTIVATSAPQPMATFDNLKKGIYSINISDDAGCTFTTAEAEIAEPDPMVAFLVRTQALSCDQEAELTLTVTGGTPAAGGIYQWSLSETGPFVPMDGGNSHVFTVPAGSYAYYVTDGNNCQAVLSNTITETAIVPLTVNVDASAAIINCSGENTAILTVRATGGLGNYNYGLFTDIDLTHSAAPANTTGIFRNLPAGTYYVSVISVDCETVSLPIEIREPAPLEVFGEATDVACYGEESGSIVIDISGGTPGYQFAISPNLNKFDSNNTFTELAPGDYTVIAQDAKGCFEVLYFTIIEPSELVLSATTEDEICYGNEDGIINLGIAGGTGPYSTSLNSNLDSDFVEGRFVYDNLAPGNHLVFVKDANGCIQNIMVEILAGANLDGTVEVVYECSGVLPTNYLSINRVDGTVVPDLLYALDSTDPNDMVLSPDFRNLSPGLHTLTIAHANGCMRTFDFEVADFEPLNLELSHGEINQIVAQVSGGNPAYTYQISGGNETAENTFMIRRTDTYTVTVTDQNGCSISADFFIEFIDIEIPNFFTPDGNGINDLWKPRNIEAFPNIHMVLFDRYGREVYRMRQDTRGWDGIYNDTNLPAGDYWYIIKLNGPEDKREFVGHFTLYR